jgi:hypothetical protein
LLNEGAEQTVKKVLGRQECKQPSTVGIEYLRSGLPNIAEKRVSCVKAFLGKQARDRLAWLSVDQFSKTDKEVVVRFGPIHDKLLLVVPGLCFFGTWFLFRVVFAGF